MPVFYRESLASLLALEKPRNPIKANITAGITLYSDHKPGLYENSLINKGQLSAWRLLEPVDLLSIVENLYRTGGEMLLADPLSRLCAPSDGFYDVSLPAKVDFLLKCLPQQVAECKTMRVFANKDTAAVACMVQKWRKPINPISQGKFGSFIEPKQWQIRCRHQAAGIDHERRRVGTQGLQHRNTSCGHWYARNQGTNSQRKIFCSSHLHLPDPSNCQRMDATIEVVCTACM